MSGVFRCMLAKKDKPLVGDQRDMLGVRAGNSDGPNDIEIESDGSVLPSSGGLSVGPEWRSLPPHLIPRRLKTKVREARCKRDTYVFRLSNASFKAEQLTEHLKLTIESETHGTIRVTDRMPIDDFQGYLADTRDLWVIDEE